MGGTDELEQAEEPDYSVVLNFEILSAVNVKDVPPLIALEFLWLSVLSQGNMISVSFPGLSELSGISLKNLSTGLKWLENRGLLKAVRKNGKVSVRILSPPEALRDKLQNRLDNIDAATRLKKLSKSML